MERRFRSRKHEFARRSNRRRFGIYPEWRETLVHKFNQGRRVGGDGKNTAEDREWQGAQANQRVYRRCRSACSRFAANGRKNACNGACPSASITPSRGKLRRWLAMFSQWKRLHF